jgi:hypothetical protein
MQLTQMWLQYYHTIATTINSTATILDHCNFVNQMQQSFATPSKPLYLKHVSLRFLRMVAIHPSIPTKFLALQYSGVEFDTKPCSV